MMKEENIQKVNGLTQEQLNDIHRVSALNIELLKAVSKNDIGKIPIIIEKGAINLWECFKRAVAHNSLGIMRILWKEIERQPVKTDSTDNPFVKDLTFILMKEVAFSRNIDCMNIDVAKFLIREGAWDENAIEKLIYQECRNNPEDADAFIIWCAMKDSKILAHAQTISLQVIGDLQKIIIRLRKERVESKLLLEDIDTKIADIRTLLGYSDDENEE